MDFLVVIANDPFLLALWCFICFFVGFSFTFITFSLCDYFTSK
jgi:hypothetical protein